MRGKKKINFQFIIKCILFLLVLVLAVGLVFRFTNIKDKITEMINPTFSVSNDGKKYTGENNTVVLPSSGLARFTVKGCESYKIKIVPNVTQETDFSYTAGGDEYNYSQANVGSLFLGDENFKNGDFIVDCTQYTSFESVLSKLHNGAKIELDRVVSFPFLMILTSGNKTITVAFGFPIMVTGVEFVPDNVVL